MIAAFVLCSTRWRPQYSHGLLSQNNVHEMIVSSSLHRLFFFVLFCFGGGGYGAEEDEGFIAGRCEESVCLFHVV